MPFPFFHYENNFESEKNLSVSSSLTLFSLSISIISLTGEIHFEMISCCCCWLKFPTSSLFTHKKSVTRLPFYVQDEKDKKIRELSTQLQRTNQQLAECRNKLDMVLKDIENHTSHLTKSIQEIVEKVKEVEDEEEEEEEEDQLQPS